MPESGATAGNDTISGTVPVAPSMQRVGLGPGGVQPNGNAYGAAFSPDGNHIGFYSFASNLVPGDVNGTQDAFIADPASGAVSALLPQAFPSGAVTALYANQQLRRQVSFSADGTKAVILGDDAAGLVAGDHNGKIDIFWVDLVRGQSRLVSHARDGAAADGDNYYPTLSADGATVTWTSYATNLTPGDTNRSADIFAWNASSDAVTLLSVSATGGAGNRGSALSVMSSDGRLVAFQSAASNLVAGDANLSQDIFVKNLETGTIVRVSAADNGTEPAGSSTHPAFSADGIWVAFQSDAALLAADVNGNTDIYARNLVTGELRLISTDATGGVALIGDSSHPAFSPDGSRVVFQTSTPFDRFDTNNKSDIYVKDLVTGAVTLVSATPGGAAASGNSNHPFFSPDGSRVVFVTDAADLAPGDTNRAFDIYVATLAASGNDQLSGGAGNDSLLGLAGDDRLNGGPGDDTLDGGDGLDTATYAGATAAVHVTLGQLRPQATGGAGADLLIGIENLLGSAFADTLVGDTGANQLDGGAGDDWLQGGGGGDTLLGGLGADKLTGGSGADLFLFRSLAQSSAEVAQRDRIADFSGTEGDRIDLHLLGTGITLVANFTGHGNELAQRVTSSGVLVSLDVNGDKVADFALLVNGSAPLSASDFILSAPGAPAGPGPGNDSVVGMAGNDYLLGLGGDDTLLGGGGNDTLDGGDGIDAASYAGAAAAVRVSLAQPRPQDTGAEGTDQLMRIENLIGSAFADTLTGDPGANLLQGGSGDDWLTGGDGADTLLGGPGGDKLTGGTGSDVFVFAAASESTADAALRDRIMDFSRAEGDRVDLRLVDTGIVLVAGFGGHAHELTQRLVSTGTLVSLDIDGDRIADFALLVTGATYLGASDFILG